MSQILFSFHGGACLEHHKALVFEQPAASLAIPKQLHIPLIGHRHEPALDMERALRVQAGQWVSANEALTEAMDDWHAASHAPYSGIIASITQGPDGPTAIVLACDQDQQPKHPAADAPAQTPLPNLAPDALMDHLRSMGIVGLGGAKFPTAEKMRQARGAVHTLILNGVECEPYIVCDEILMRSRPSAIILGGRLLAKAVGAKRLILAVEDPLKDQLGSVLEGFKDNHQPHPLDPDLIIECVRVPARFPQGSERQLIKTLTGHEVPSLGLPKDLGVVSCNVATAASVFDACVHNQPLTHRWVSITGDAVASPINVYAPIGAPICDLIEAAGGYQSSACKLILGGPVSGTEIIDDEQCIDKGTLALTVLSNTVSKPNRIAMPCINCGFCVDVCPSQLLPQTLFKLSSHEQHAEAQAAGLMACIECGLCGEVCPSQLPLIDWYRYSKDQLRSQNADQQRQALAKRRHEARNKRIEEKQSAREAKRLARAARLQETQTAQSEIKAAIARAKVKKPTPQ